MSISTVNQNDEVWLPVKLYRQNGEFLDFTGLYEVSDQGRVRNKRGKLFTPKLQGKGYPGVSLRWNKKTYHVYVHRLVVSTHFGDPGSLHIDHIDGTKTNNCAWNLRIVTRSQNLLHASHVLGHYPPTTRLTDDLVREMKALSRAGVPAKELSSKFGVRKNHVYQILNGKHWPHIP